MPTETQAHQGTGRLRTWARSGIESYYRAQCRVLGYPNRFVFLLGTMRSGSSLLSHILMSNPQITGIGESHVSYTNPDYLVDLTIKVHQSLRKPLLTRHWILDKVLHDYIHCDSVFDADRCRFVFLLREPSSTLASLVRAFPDWFTGRDLPIDECRERSERYLQQRFGQLERNIGKVRAARCPVLFLEYADLLDRTTETLAALSRFLELARPLTEEYSTNRFTGAAGFGDPSRYIGGGRIIRNRANGSATQALEPRKATSTAYNRLRDALRSDHLGESDSESRSNDAAT